MSRFGLIAILLAFATGAAAGVDTAPPSRVAIGGQELHLAGCTVREVMWADLYSLALYVPARMPQRATFEDRGWAKAVHFQVLWDVICPLQSGPWTILVWTRQEKGNGQETRA